PSCAGRDAPAGAAARVPSAQLTMWEASGTAMWVASCTSTGIAVAGNPVAGKPVAGKPVAGSPVGIGSRSRFLIGRIGLDDLLDQRVAHHVPGAEMSEADAVDVAEHVAHVHQPGFLPFR